MVTIEKPRVGAVILAAGQGRRMGADINKPYLMLHGLPIVYYALARFGSSSLMDEIVLVVRESEAQHVQEQILNKHAFNKRIKVVIGGAERQDSACNGLRAISSESVLIHDGVRPFFSSDLLKRLTEAANEHKAVIPALKATDTLIVSSKENMTEKVVDRSQVWRVQTPQLFKTSLVREALSKAQESGQQFTDDASAVLTMCGVKAKVIEGEEWNIKITTPWDLQLAECLGRTLLV